MELKDMIPLRKSVRSYSSEPLEESVLESIRAFGQTMRPLYPNIRVHFDIVSQDQVRFYFPWKAPHLMAIYSQNTPGYLENVGFLFQQMDLYLQTIGLGACWMGLGKLRQESTPAGMEFVILLAFGTPQGDARRSGPQQFKRRPAAEIADLADPALEPARLAPSSTNSQPWYFVHSPEGCYHAYRSEAGVLRHKLLGVMNRIDMGIALAHLYVSHPEGFSFFEAAHPPVKGHSYTGSFLLSSGQSPAGTV